MKGKEISNDNHKIIFAGRYCKNSLSGPQQFAAGLFNEYCKFKNAVFIEYFFDGREYSLFKKLFGFETIEVKNGIIYKTGLFRIIPLLTVLKPDIVHLLTFERFAVLFFIYKLFFKVKIFYNSHGVIYYENRVLKSNSSFYTIKDRICEKIFLKYSDRIIFPSYLTLDLAEKYYQIDEKKVLILANFINDSFFIAKSKQNSSNELKAVYIYKNILNSSGLEMMKRFLLNDKSKIKFYIITGGQKINLPETKTSIELLNFIPNDKLPEFYADKDIFLSLNYYDTFSISTGEAMAAGLIPVVTEQTGISRYIENGINGFKFNYNNPEKLADILEHLEQMSEEARKIIWLSAIDTISELKAENIMEIYKTEYKAAYD